MIEQQDLEIYDLMLANEQGEEESDSDSEDISASIMSASTLVRASQFFINTTGSNPTRVFLGKIKQFCCVELSAILARFIRSKDIGSWCSRTASTYLFDDLSESSSSQFFQKLT
jgi:hypothetical protein